VRCNIFAALQQWVPHIGVQAAQTELDAVMHLTLPSLSCTATMRRSKGPLEPLREFGSNPGQLNAWQFVPKPDTDGQAMPLVVVLHGCTQNAAGYDRGSGWSELATAYGFAVLFPEQQRSNNANLCFNWFEPGDTRRDAGEALSIAQMVDAMIAQNGLDRQRVYISGLSAGGAMTSVMLALYPEMFAGGAILAGLPHGAAASVQEALQQMRSPSPTRRTSGSSIKHAAQHPGPWPTVSIWHGTADSVVSPSNADAIARQWKDVHGLGDSLAKESLVDGVRHRAWRNADGATLVEEYRISGMGHGTPLATTGECGCGEAGAFMLDVGISSTVHSARTWGLLDKRRLAAREITTTAIAGHESPRTMARHAPSLPATGHGPGRIGQVIEDALRKAGLMK
jgi:poly(hydroxyalkanoate) depolymerase family esterase